jgi:two-component system NtrC family sensor kinase
MNGQDSAGSLVDACMLPGAGVTLEFLAAILDHIAQPIFVKDREFRFVLLNRAASQLLGRPRGEMLGRTDHDFFPRAEADFFRARDLEVVTRGEAVYVEEEPLTDHDGVRHTLATTKVPLRGAGGEVTHIVGIIKDVTALKRAEEALREANEALERRVRERTADLEAAQSELMRRERLTVVGQLAGAIAHQIRNPLGSIKNAAYLLKLSSGPSPDPDVTQSLAVIHDEVRRANQIITDLLDYARIGPASLREVSLAYVVEQSLGGVQMPDATRVTVAVSDRALVRADPDQLQMAVFNLIRGSVESMPDGGELALTAERSGPWWELVIRDTGPGLPDEVRDQLRDPLATQSRRVALGLHLMTGRALVENQGGEFEVDSGGDRGTRFFVRVAAAG